MIKKVLILVPAVRLSEKPSRFPLGLAYVAASLENCGVSVSVLDLNIVRSSPQSEESKIAEAIQTVDAVCAGGMITMLSNIARYAAYVKKYRPQIPVVIGGPLASNFEEMILRKTGIDILVKGEGEEVMPELISALPDKDLLKKINGLAFLHNDELCSTLPARRIQNLDSLPLPAYHLFPFEKYIRNRGICAADIIGSRGCPYACGFCFRNFGNKVVFRSVDSIIDEIRLLKSIYQIEHIYFEDELFIQSKDYVRSFCREIQKLKNITWGACARVDTLTLDLIKEMKVSGCNMLMIGIESFSDDRLTEMNKKITVEQINKVCSWMNQTGIKINPGLIIGMPGETKESVHKTIEGCIRHGISVSKWTYAFATPYPGTKLYSDAKHTGIIRDDWAYIQKLCDVGDTCNLAVNLTKFSDRELIQMRNSAVRIITRHLIFSFLSRANPVLGRYINAVRKRVSLWKRKIKMFFRVFITPFNHVCVEHFRDNLSKDAALKLFKKSVRIVEIEVFSFCNRRCWFCSNNIIDRHSENIRMPEKIYYKILANLKEINYRKVVSYSRYNEPLADKIILKRLSEARTYLPRAVLHLNTNGDYLSRDYLNKLYDAGLKSLSVQVYLPDGVEYTDELANKYLISRIKYFEMKPRFVLDRPAGWIEYRLKFYDMVVRLYARNFKINGTDRGGIIPSLEKGRVRESPCLIPFYNVYIDYNGKIVPCCNIRSDWPKHSGYILGNLNEERETLFSIFASSKMVAWRRRLINYSRKVTPCNSCRFEEILPTLANIQAADRKSRDANS